DLGRDDVSRVDVKESFSFFNTDSSLSEKVISTFQDFQHKGRRISVEISQSGGGGGRSSGRKRSERGDKGDRGDFKSKGAHRSSESSGRRRSSGAGEGGENKTSGKGGSRKKNIESSVNRRKLRRS
ncbi:MAG: DbpA RNA binding domain-containing protein, partial [Gillisia sp.]|nr:DbpA RNA binding domain-containing protein [Gillisia sp.]